MNKVSKKDERLGLEKCNKWNEPMKIIEYNGANNIIVEFQDEWKEKKKTDWKSFCGGGVVNPHIKKSRIGVEKFNNQGCLMKVIDYINSNNVLIEFQDKYKFKKTITWNNFQLGTVKNPYHPTVCNIGITGTKYPSNNTYGETKEYKAWSAMITRCYTKTLINGENHYRRYENKEICEEWLLYENFYEWMHSQENFEQLMKIKDIELEKDILYKGNNIYSPETCCLVPHNVNSLFVKADRTRGNYPIGVTYKTRDKVFEVQCNINGKETYLGRVHDPIEGFYIYKNFKEKYIK